MPFKFHYRLLFFFLLVLISCATDDYADFSITKTGIKYKLVTLGPADSESPAPGDYITVDLAYKTLNDSLFFKGIRKFKLTGPSFPGEIDECFMLMHTGDSAVFIINAYNFFTKTVEAPVPGFLKKDNKMKVEVLLRKIQKNKDFEKEKTEFMSWIKDFKDYEKVLLSHYVDDNVIGVKPVSTGLYKNILVKGNGVEIERGDTIICHYEGKFLSGKFFDSTRKRKMPFEFVYGQEMQVIKGLEEAIGEMSEGEKTVFIIPSEKGFGKEGSTAGVIPPYTSLIFEVEIISVKKARKPNSVIP
ncbi:MAG: hypothetical protein A2W91_03745 [Bacteroidetes bacterium GWF2_38_335]|nr:MAG: hypothetical protein A2W91_03745 [Bacteroidetes bacterium GWF2_38_335]OFY77403.1 MAG: hypothetical protein A2281_01015 [Bacteroidetes bacterium RIFOXYA12_FULL_38_20]HBS87309.1 hypothetical protein [Bacteroidales bacterium]